MRGSRTLMSCALLAAFSASCSGKSARDGDFASAGTMEGSGGSSTGATGGSSTGATGGSSTGATGGANMEATGGSSMKATGGANMEATGGTNMEATGGANMEATGGANMEATGGANMEATGGSSGGPVAGGGMGGATEEPVRIIRGEPDGEFWDLTIRGQGLDDHDGKTVLVRIGWPDRPPERLGSGETRIADGTFELVFPAVWETSLYKTKVVLLDLDGDRACDTSRDRVFGDSRAVQAEVLIVNNEPSWEPNEMQEGVDDRFCQWFNSEWPIE